MTTDQGFTYDLTESHDESNWKTTTIACHGRLVSSTAHEIDAVVRPLIQGGGHILIDLTDVEYVDSSGLGTLVGLKVSAINKGYCKLELLNLSPKVKQLLTLTNLAQLFSQQ